MNVEFLVEVPEQYLHLQVLYNTFLAKLAIQSYDGEAILIDSRITTTGPLKPDAVLAIHGAHVTVDESGVETHFTTHHVMQRAGFGYVLEAEETANTTIVSDPEDTIALTTLIATNAYACGTSDTMPPLIPEQKRPE